MYKRSLPIKKLNNRGMSLVELLVAVVILAIIMVPLLHSFVSSSKLNGKSQRVLKATMIAENVMEEFDDVSVEDLAKKYSVTGNSGIYTFDFSSDQLSEYGTDEYQAIVTLNPGDSYEAYNQVSLSDVSAITSEHSALYAVSPTYDESVYTTFAERNVSARSTDPSYATCDAAFFETNLNRNISVVITKGSKATDADGNQIDLAKVVLTIEYAYNNNATTKALLTSDLKYTETKVLFDNTTTKTALEHIYILYTPRYLATNPLLGASAKSDVISIRNLNNLEVGVSVIRQETDTDSTYLPNYLTHQRAQITVYENPVWTGSYTKDTPGAIQLRTNLLKTDAGTSISTSGCELIYSNSNGAKKATGTVAENILSLKTAQGKNLDGSATKDRIYEMTVKVYHNSDLTNPIAVLNGTKIE